MRCSLGLVELLPVFRLVAINLLCIDISCADPSLDAPGKCQSLHCSVTLFSNVVCKPSRTTWPSALARSYMDSADATECIRTVDVMMPLGLVNTTPTACFTAGLQSMHVLEVRTAIKHNLHYASALAQTVEHSSVEIEAMGWEIEASSDGATFEIGTTHIYKEHVVGSEACEGHLTWEEGSCVAWRRERIIPICGFAGLGRIRHGGTCGWGVAGSWLRIPRLCNVIHRGR